MGRSFEKLNAENIASRYIEVVLTDGEPIYTCGKDSEFSSMSDCTNKYIKFPKWSCVLNYCIEYPGVFVTDSEIKSDKDFELTFIYLQYYEDISYCYLQKELLPEHVKTYNSCINIENVDKVKVTTRKSIVLKYYSFMDFHSEYHTQEIENLSF